MVFWARNEPSGTWQKRAAHGMSRTLPSGHRMDDVDGGAWFDARIQPLKVADTLGSQKYVDERAQLARFVADVKPQSRVVLLQCVDDLTYRSRGNLYLVAAPRAVEQLAGDVHRNRFHAPSCSTNI